MFSGPALRRLFGSAGILANLRTERRLQDLCEERFEPIYTLFLQLTDDVGAAERLTARTFTRAQHLHQRFRPAPAAFEIGLYRLAILEFCRHVPDRSDPRRSAAGTVGPHFGDRRSRVRRAMRRLSVPQQIALVLVYWFDMGTRSVAEILCLPHREAVDLIHAAYRRLQRLLLASGPAPDDEPPDLVA